MILLVSLGRAGEILFVRRLFDAPEPDPIGSGLGAWQSVWRREWEKWLREREGKRVFARRVCGCSKGCERTQMPPQKSLIFLWLTQFLRVSGAREPVRRPNRQNHYSSEQSEAPSTCAYHCSSRRPQDNPGVRKPVRTKTNSQVESPNVRTGHLSQHPLLCSERPQGLPGIRNLSEASNFVVFARFRLNFYPNTIYFESNVF